MTAATSNKWQVFSLVAAGAFISNLDSSILNVALPVIMEDLDISLKIAEWVPMAYLLALAALLLPCGRLSDIRGRRFAYAGGFSLFTIGSLLCAVSFSVSWLICSRLAQGAGAAMLLASSPALIVDTFPMQERGRALGLVGTVVAAGLIAGPAAGGLILHYFSWRLIFFINIPIGIFFAALALKTLSRRDSSTPMVPMDWPGTLLLVICFSSLILEISHLGDWGLISRRSGLAWLIFIASATALCRIETRRDHPVFNPALLRIRLFILPVLSAVIMYCVMFFMTLMMPLFLVNPLGMTMRMVGFLMMVPFVFLLIMAPLAGSLADKMGSRLLCTFGMGILMVAMLSFAHLSAASKTPFLTLELALAGIGIALFMTPNSRATMSAIPAQHRGIASGSVAAARSLGMVLGVALAGLLFNSAFSSLSGGQEFKAFTQDNALFFITAFRHAMYGGTFVAFAGMIIAYLRGQDPV